MQLRFSSLICRIIVLQKYTVCFQEDARLEDCEFYLKAQQFMVLPMERQRLESSNGNQEPSVLLKIKDLWLRSLALKNAPSSEPSISQLIDAIRLNQLEVLRENAQECLDLEVPKETVKDEVPITQWEVERRKERGEDIFMVPANMLVIPPEEEPVTCDAPKADMCKATPGKSSDERTVPDDPGVISQTSSAESTAVSESLSESLDNPWNRLNPISLALNSSDETILQQDHSLKTQQDVAADSNTPDLLEPCSLDSPQGEPVQTSSPSLLCSYANTSPVETRTTQRTSAAKAACDASCPAQGPQVSRGSPGTPSSLSPVLPVLPSSHSRPPPEKMPH
ncbi:Adrenocortical dysplasia protein, partial [Eurypyga helias]